MFQFKIIHQDTNTKARTGEIVTPNGIVKTPAFIFCATKGALKFITAEQARQCNTQIILSNTYHMMLRPGSTVVKNAGGLGKFTGWHGPTFTDSGGFQIFSLGGRSVGGDIKSMAPSGKNKTLLSIDENGAKFKSYIDGSVFYLTPEQSAIEQINIGADIIMPLDECTSSSISKIDTERSMKMSHRWETRSINEMDKYDTKQVMYGIIQGGVYPDLRKESCEFVKNDQRFAGYAIGGSLGSSVNEMHDVIELTMKILQPEKPVHLLGIGKIHNIIKGVKEGIDTFDCVHPTRLARHGGALVMPSMYGKEYLNIKNNAFKDDYDPIDISCQCVTCSNYSRSYIHWMLKAEEASAMTMITMHNIFFMNRLMATIRMAIENNTISSLAL